LHSIERGVMGIKQVTKEFIERKCRERIRKSRKQRYAPTQAVGWCALVGGPYDWPGFVDFSNRCPERNTRRRISLMRCISDSSLIDHRLTTKCAMNCLETLVSSPPFQWNLSNQSRINRET